MSGHGIYLRNKFTRNDLLGNIVSGVALHPVEYVKILLQLGYEPFDAYPTTTLFLRKRMALPGIFSYWKLIYRTDGFFGLFNGLTYKISWALSHQFVYINLRDAFEQIDKQESQLDEGDSKEPTAVVTFEKLISTLMKATTCKVISLAVSYPFQVLLIRKCAQFIGRETIYDSFPSAIQDVYSNEGFFGFYAGFGPQILGECISLWLSHSIVFFIERYIVRSPLAYDPHVYLSTTTKFIVRTFVYPFHVVSTVMSINGCKSLTKSVTEPQYVNWVHCWRHLRQLGHLNRGSSLIFRYPVSDTISLNKKTQKSM